MVNIRVKDYDVVVVEGDVMFVGIVGGVEVVGVGGEFGGDSVDLFYEWGDFGFGVYIMD